MKLPSRKICRIVGTSAFCVMMLIIAGALAENSPMAGHAPVVHLCWGDDGDLPAMVLEDSSSNGQRQAMALLPGGASSGYIAATRIRNLGFTALESLFMPTGAPFPKGAAAIARRLEIGALQVACDNRSRLNWSKLRNDLLQKGTHINELLPCKDNGQRWRAEMPRWTVTYQKGTNGLFSGTIRRNAPNAPVLRYAMTDTGEFVISMFAADSTAGEKERELYRLPKTNRSGHAEITYDLNP